MVKYRKLSIEELEELKTEFIQFLAVNGIDAEKWQDIKKNNITEAEQFIDSFSDVVLEKSLQSIKYIEHRTSTDYKVFFYDEQKATMIGVKSSSVNLLENSWIERSEELLIKDKISFIKGVKHYTDTRLKELFEMLKKGCVPTDQKLYTLLKKVAE